MCLQGKVRNFNRRLHPKGKQKFSKPKPSSRAKAPGKIPRKGCSLIRESLKRTRDTSHYLNQLARSMDLLSRKGLKTNRMLLLTILSRYFCTRLKSYCKVLISFLDAKIFASRGVIPPNLKYQHWREPLRTVYCYRCRKVEVW